MSKSLKTLQTISKIGKIISDIIFVCSIIGAVACIIAVSALASSQNIVLEGQSMVDLIESMGINFVTVIFSCVISIFACIGSAVVAKFASNYFANELACYPDEEWLEVHPEDEVTEEAELKMLLARE